MNVRTVSRTLVSILFTALAFVGIGALAQPASADTAAPAAAPAPGSELFEAKVQRQINKQRKHFGLSALKFDPCADQSAESWGAHLAAISDLIHQVMGDVMDGCNATYAGETLASGITSPKQVVRLWMESPGHRAILLSKSPKRVGVGAYVEASGAWTVAANFTRY